MYISRDAYRPRVIDHRQSEAYTHVLQADQTAPPLARQARSTNAVRDVRFLSPDIRGP